MIDSVTSRDTAPVRRLFRLPDTTDDAFLHLGLHVQGSVSVTRAAPRCSWPRRPGVPRPGPA